MPDKQEIPDFIVERLAYILAWMDESGIPNLFSLVGQHRDAASSVAIVLGDHAPLHHDMNKKFMAAMGSIPPGSKVEIHGNPGEN